MGNEHRFPTIRDTVEALTALADAGLGDLPVQIIIAPDSTLQAIARNAGRAADDRPALMINLGGASSGRMVGIICTERLDADPPNPGVQ